MSTMNLGRVVPLDKGDYSASATYELNHLVHHNGSVYWHYGATATTGVAPSDTSVWRVVIDAQAVDAYVGRSETAAGSAEAAQAAAEAAQSAAESAQTAAEGAQSAAEAAQTAAESAQSATEDSAEDAEAWAVGQIGGTDVPSSDSRYHNNAKYYKEQAAAANQAAQAVLNSIPSDYSTLSGLVNALTASTPSLNDSRAVEINNGSDFNNYTTPGTFFVREQIEPNFSHAPNQNPSGRLYVVELVNYQGVLQIFLPEDEKARIYTRFKNAQTYPGSWGAWEKTALVSDLVDADVEEITTWSANHLYIKNNGDTVDLEHPSSTSSVNIHYLVTQCAPGDQFKVTATGGSSYRAYSFLDASSNVLSVALSYEALTDAILTAPMGSAKLLVNDNTLTGSVYKGKFYDPNLLSLKNKYYLDLASGTDLNNVTQPGNYLSPNSGITNTLIHCPVANTGFVMKTIETTTAGSSTRFFQLLIVNAGEPQIFARGNVGSWGEWTRLCMTNDTILPTDIHLTSSNYLTYFPNGSFNDAPVNSIVGIGDNVPLTDGPDGDAWIGYGSHTSTGYISGTLLTFRPHRTNASVYRGISQILIGYRATDYSPTLSYRIAVVGNNGLDWSAWSKFEQNGYLRAGNRVISAGRMSESVSDLDNMPQNVMWQIDKNCTGETAESTLGHHPFPGVSCVAVNMAFSYSSRHGQVQTVYALDGRVAWRYGYQNDVNDYRWKPWTYYATYIPTAPTTDGTYTLQCTVSNGTASYAWVGVT